MLAHTIRKIFWREKRAQAPDADRDPLPNPLKSLPDGLRLYAIGDIHGRADLLAAMHDLIDRIDAAQPAERTIEIVLGDMIDRGPASAEVLSRLLDRARLREVKALRGNHEDMLLHFLANAEGLSRWARLGGLDTLQSYGVRPDGPIDDAVAIRTARLARAAIPPEHLAFLTGLPSSWTFGGFTFVHAGLRPGCPLPAQAERDLLEIREPFLSHAGSFGTYVIHGHTPTRDVEIRHNRINLDTGAFATGRLSALLLERNRLEILEPAIGMRPA